MAKGASNNTSRARSSISRDVAFKNSLKNKCDRPGTPYPKANNFNMAKDGGGTNQYTNMGPPPTPIPDAASSRSFTTVAATDYNDVYSANLRLRRELEELKARELFIAQSGGASNASTPASGELFRERFTPDKERINWLNPRSQPRHRRTERRRDSDYEPYPGAGFPYECRLEHDEYELSKSDTSLVLPCDASQEGECEDEASVSRLVLPNGFDGRTPTPTYTFPFPEARYELLMPRHS